MAAKIQTLKKYIQNVLSDCTLETDIDDLLDSFEKHNLSKNEMLVEEGRICPYFCYIDSGVLQHSITILGEEKTTYLGLKNSVTTALNSFKNKTPSRKTIRALCDTQLYVLTFKVFDELLRKNTTFKSFYFNLIENQIFLIDDYRIDLLTLTPEERYTKLLANDPALVKEVPLHYLSSFLGISSRHMSRIRKNIN